eukprot:SAG31_NODE_10204_length_1171_cov_1.305970_1_plen_75_part_01
MLGGPEAFGAAPGWDADSEDKKYNKKGSGCNMVSIISVLLAVLVTIGAGYFVVTHRQAAEAALANSKNLELHTEQ